MTELICRLDPRLFAVHSACLADRGALRTRLEAAAVSITEFPLHGLASAGAVRQMLRFARWCRARSIQIVQTCDFYANVFALPAAALAQVPVRIGSRRDVFIPERTHAQQRLQRVAYRFTHRIVVNAAAVSERLVEEGVPAWKMVHIPNGLDLNSFKASPSPATPSRRVVTTVANLRHGKGHEVLLRAAAHVTRRAPDVRFQIVGDGTRRQELEREAVKLGIASHVHFVGPCTDVPGVLRHSDVFAFPSYMEASPNAVIEAMAAGLPIVASGVGGIPEIIEHERNGLLVPAGDDRLLADAILRLLERPSLAAGLGEAARKTVDARFSFERMTSEFQALYLNELSVRVATPFLSMKVSAR